MSELYTWLVDNEYRITLTYKNLYPVESTIVLLFCQPAILSSFSVMLCKMGKVQGIAWFVNMLKLK